MCKNILEIIKINNLSLYKKKKIKIQGWVKNKRISNIGILFVDINDGSTHKDIQIVIKYKKFKKKIPLINIGCSIKIIGTINFNEKIKTNEINAYKIKILGKIDNPKSYPISPKYHTLKYLRTISHLKPRTKLISSISRVRNSLVVNIHNFLQKKNFLWIPTPILTPFDTEGTSKMFQIKNNFFNKETFLTVSGQLNLEAYACSLSKVYNFSPVFRAENSNTNKHLAEFWMLEVEIAFYHLKNIIKFCKKILSYIINKTINKNYEDIIHILKYNKKNESIIKYILNNKFIELEYSEIINIINKKEKFIDSIKWGSDISSKQEKYLTEKYFKSPIIIKNYPKNIKAFYMKTNEDNKTVSSMDIIYPYIGEIIGGSERECNIKKLDLNIKQKKLNKTKYWWYRDLRKFGTIPHSGFGLGLERLLMYITHIKNIKDIIPFPRYPKYLEF